MSDYDVDIYAWSQRQGALLRRLAAGERVNDADLDWPNIAEEIETVGRSERAAVRSHIQNVVEHLLKLQASPAIEPRRGWRETISRARVELEVLLNDSPSLRPAVPRLIEAAMPRARRLAAIAIDTYSETPRLDLKSITYDEGQILGDWFPDSP
jgi:hypothetical protein